MEEELDNAEVAEQLTILKELLCKNPESIKVADEQLKSLIEHVNSRFRKIEIVREQARRNEADRKIKEQRLLEEKEKRAAAEKAQAEVENARKRMERLMQVDQPSSPTPSAVRAGTVSNNESTSDVQDPEETIIASSNNPSVDFLSFIQADGAYLMLKKDKFPDHLANSLKHEGLGYPLGVAYDEELKLWFICDRNFNKILLLNIEKEDMTVCDGAIESPTAVMIYHEGHNAAVLCSDKSRQHTIYIYNYKNMEKPFLQSFASSRDEIYDMKHQMRGLAKSFGGNILSLENGPKKRLRVFNRDVGGKGFEIKGAQSPSFIASYRSTVAVSDLGVNKVFIMDLNDSSWENISFRMLRVIDSSLDLPLDKLANQNGFKFVAGMQFDINGHLLIGDAKGHSIKLYDTDYNFLHRISSDFILPYVSSFHVNKDGECVLLDVQGHQKFHYVKMTSIPEILPWIQPASHSSSGSFPQKPRRGGFQSRNFNA